MPPYRLREIDMTVQSPAQKPESVTMRVVHEVADTRDLDPTELHPPLGSVIDPDALETLLETRADSGIAVEFSYAGCHVSVSGDDIDVTAQAGGE